MHAACKVRIVGRRLLSPKLVGLLASSSPLSMYYMSHSSSYTSSRYIGTRLSMCCRFVQVTAPFKLTPHLQTHSAAKSTYALQHIMSSRLDAATLDWATDLTKRNCQHMYQQVWGWDHAGKRAQLSHVRTPPVSIAPCRSPHRAARALQRLAIGRFVIAHHVTIRLTSISGCHCRLQTGIL